MYRSPTPTYPSMRCGSHEYIIEPNCSTALFTSGNKTPATHVELRLSGAIQARPFVAVFRMAYTRCIPKRRITSLNVSSTNSIRKGFKIIRVRAENVVSGLVGLRIILLTAQTTKGTSALHNKTSLRYLIERYHFADYEM